MGYKRWRSECNASVAYIDHQAEDANKDDHRKGHQDQGLTVLLSRD
jgi:hypothetical protein